MGENPFRPTLSPQQQNNKGRVDPSLIRQLQETSYEQHEHAQAGDTTASVDSIKQPTSEQQYTLGSVGRFSHPTQGMIHARYVQFGDLVEGPIDSCGMYYQDGVGKAWVVTNRESLASNAGVCGVHYFDKLPPKDSYGWVQITGPSAFPVTVQAESIAVDTPVGINSSGLLAAEDSNPVAYPTENIVTEGSTTVIPAGAMWITPSDTSIVMGVINRRLAETAQAVSLLQQPSPNNPVTSMVTDLTEQLNKRIATIEQSVGQTLASIQQANFLVQNQNSIESDTETSLARVNAQVSVANYLRELETGLDEVNRLTRRVSTLAFSVVESERTTRTYTDEAGLHVETTVSARNDAVARRNESEEFALASFEHSQQAEVHDTNAGLSATAVETARQAVELIEGNVVGVAAAVEQTQTDIDATASQVNQQSQIVASQASQVQSDSDEVAALAQQVADDRNAVAADLTITDSNAQITQQQRALAEQARASAEANSSITASHVTDTQTNLAASQDVLEAVESDLAATNANAIATAADRVAVSQDRTRVESDAAIVASNRVITEQARASAETNAAITASHVTDTQTNLTATQQNRDVVQGLQESVESDLAETNANAVSTAADRAAVAQDRVQVESTAAVVADDRVITEQARALAESNAATTASHVSLTSSSVTAAQQAEDGALVARDESEANRDLTAQDAAATGNDRIAVEQTATEVEQIATVVESNANITSQQRSLAEQARAVAQSNAALTASHVSQTQSNLNQTEANRQATASDAAITSQQRALAETAQAIATQESQLIAAITERNINASLNDFPAAMNPDLFSFAPISVSGADAIPVRQSHPASVPASNDRILTYNSINLNQLAHRGMFRLTPYRFYRIVFDIERVDSSSTNFETFLQLRLLDDDFILRSTRFQGVAGRAVLSPGERQEVSYVVAYTPDGADSRADMSILAGNYTQLRPTLVLNRSGGFTAPPELQSIIWAFWVEDITDRLNSTANAAAAQSSATAALTSSQTAAADRLGAQTAASLATQERALAQAINDSIEATAIILAQQAAEVSDNLAQVQSLTSLSASLATGLVNPNGDFSAFSGNNIPDSWVNATGDVALKTKVDGIAPRVNALRIIAPANMQQAGILKRFTDAPTTIGTVQGGQFIVIRMDATLNSGTFRAAGMFFQPALEGGGFNSNIRISMTGNDVNGEQIGDGVVGERRQLEYLVQLPEDTIGYNLLLANHWPFFFDTNNASANRNDVSGANDITWHAAGFRFATAAEIELHTALPALAAEVQINQTAIANNEMAAAQLELIAAATGSSPAVVRLISNALGSSLALLADRVLIGNQLDPSNPFTAITVINNQPTIVGGLLRGATVSPSIGSTVFHELQLKPTRRLAADGDTIDYGGTYESLPTITADISNLPALPSGAAYRVSAVNVGLSSATARVRSVMAGATSTVTTGAGVDRGTLVPNFQLHKTGAADASDGRYRFTLRVRGENLGLAVDGLQGSDDLYSASGDLYVWNGSSLVVAGSYSHSWTARTGTFNYNIRTFEAILDYSDTIGIASGSNYEFGAHPNIGDILSLDRISYNTQAALSESTVDGLVPFIINPPSAVN